METRKTGALLEGSLLLVTGAAFATMFGFQMLLSVVPVYADGIGGGSAGAGLATAVFMGFTVLSQIQMPRVLRRFGYRGTLAAGIVLLGVPAFLYGLTGTLAGILTVTLARGVGFGMVTVIFAALITELAPPERRGEALGLLGISITVPTIFCNAFGLWLVDHYGFGTVFALGGAIPLLGVVFTLGLSGLPTPGRESRAGFFSGLTRGPLLRVVIIFSTMTLASGMILTFLPLYRPGSGFFTAIGGLLMLGVAATVFRWWSGRFADSHGPALLLIPGLLSSAVGVAALSADGMVMILGALLFGAGFGVLQSSSLLLTMQRVRPGEIGLGSTVWNISFDAGTGLGALLFGGVIALSGFAFAFYLCAALLVAAALVVPFDKRLSG